MSSQRFIFSKAQPGSLGFPVYTSLIHKESHKLPTAMLFDVDTGRIPIRHFKKMEINITQLCDLDPMLDDAKILARGNRVQATIRNHDIKKFQPILDEGAYVIGTIVSISDAIPFNYVGVDKIRRTVILEDYDFQSCSLIERVQVSGIVVMIPTVDARFFKYFNVKKMEINITQLCDLDPMLDDAKILARVISIWKSHPKQRPNEGNRVQATIKNHDIKKFPPILDE
ncbi:hypothetical protein Tco_0626461 [Tanacetum coccineum]|uniref:Ribosomal protein S1 n=1 Tax=Tanacetum coccineum TaxID=301880 RepID=A0ABQ4WJS1_9ASTR